MTNRSDRLREQRRMQRRIQLVVEERRLSRTESRPAHDPEKTVEIPQQALRAIGRVTVNVI